MSNRWLDQVQEDIIDPERPIIDPHHHLWNDKDGSDYELDKLWADTSSGHNILGTVFVECSTNYRKDGPEPLRPVGETEYVAEMAAESRRGNSPGQSPILAIVAHANLKLGSAVTEVFDAHREAAAGLLRGIRHSVAYYPDPPAVERYTGRIRHLLMDEDFRQGFAELAPAGLSFDAWLTHEQIPELTDIARAFPDTTIVFDHFGGPMGIGPYAGKQAEIFEQWKLDVAELATCDNVVAKLGGLAMPINGWGWNERDLPASSDEIVATHEAYYLHSIDCFGPERCMFESNFPVDKLSVSYPVLWNALKKIAARFNEDEQTAMFRGTAERVYRLTT
ncbi:MAG: amidohydrolase family protein [Pseudomonadota bacterium]